MSARDREALDALRLRLRGLPLDAVPPRYQMRPLPHKLPPAVVADITLAAALSAVDRQRALVDRVQGTDVCMLAMQLLDVLEHILATVRLHHERIRNQA